MEMPPIPKVEIKPQHVALLGVGVAFFLYIGDVGKLIASYQNWEFKNTTQFVGALLELTGHYGAAALGGGGAVANIISKQ